MTKIFLEVTRQPTYSTYNSNTDGFLHDDGSKTNNIFLKLHNASEKVYSYQTVNSPITSNKGSKYVMIVYEYKSNHIHGKLIKYCNAADLTRAYENVTKMFIPRGLKPQLHILYN